MTEQKKLPTKLSRRQVLKKAGSVMLAAPCLAFAGRHKGSPGEWHNRPTQNGDFNSPITEVVEDSTTADETVEWASGGTDLITVDYPDDSLFDTSGTCTLSVTESTTEGPCYFGVSEQEDISEGRTGLPMILCMQLVDQNCNPLEGYLIEVWHCDTEGVYSGDTTDSDDTSTFAGDFCTGGDTEAEASKWFRGELTTNSSGRINIKSCFPGWYAGRTIHIHFRVRLEYGGGDYVISQFCFDDDFAEEICTTHDQYSSRGVQDTTLASGTDTVFPSSGYSDYMLNTEKNEDGTLLAYKRIMIEV